MGDRYRIILEGPEGRVEFATCLTYRKALDLLQRLERFCVSNEIWPDVKRIVIEFPEEEGEGAERGG